MNPHLAKYPTGKTLHKLAQEQDCQEDPESNAKDEPHGQNFFKHLVFVFLSFLVFQCLRAFVLFLGCVCLLL